MYRVFRPVSEARAACEAYCDGVNTRFSRSVPWELKLVGVRHAPWTIRDSLDLYSVLNWGSDLFAINDAGDVAIHLSGQA